MMVSKGQRLLSLGLMLIFLSSYVDGINYFYQMPKKELIEIAACIAETQNPKAYNSFFQACKLPRYIEAAVFYCGRLLTPNADNVVDFFNIARKNKRLLSDVYDCSVDIVPCITDYDRNVVMRDFEKCVRGLRNTVCKKDYGLGHGLFMLLGTEAKPTE